MTTKVALLNSNELFWALVYGLCDVEQRNEQAMLLGDEGKPYLCESGLCSPSHFEKLLRSAFSKQWVLARLALLDEWPRFYQERYSPEYAAFKAARAPKAQPRERVRLRVVQ